MLRLGHGKVRVVWRALCVFVGVADGAGRAGLGCVKDQVGRIFAVGADGMVEEREVGLSFGGYEERGDWGWFCVAGLGEDVEVVVGVVVVEMKSIAFSITTYGVSAAVGVV